MRILIFALILNMLIGLQYDLSDSTKHAGPQTVEHEE